VESTRQRLSNSTIIQIAVLAALTFAVFRFPLDAMMYRWKTDGNWSHGWLVPLFSIYFLVVHGRELLAAERRPNYLGMLIVIGAIAMYWYFSRVRRFGYPQQFALIPYLMGLVLLVGGWRVLRVAWFPIAYLLFAVPLPVSTYVDLTLPLRRIASQVAGALLDWLPGVYTDVQGVVIDYQYRGHLASLNVEEACSGMRLIMAFCALGVAMAYLGDRPLWHRVIMVVCCVPIAVFCNMIRVFVTGVLSVYGTENPKLNEFAQGSAHELLGLMMLPIALGLFAFVGYVLKNLFVDEPREGGESVTA
jgi:exosortase